MGQGFIYKCEKCGHSYSVFPGSGIFYPEEYRSVISGIAEGACGEEWKALYEQTAYAAVNADRVVYCCAACGRWEIGTDITLYAPNDSAKLLKKRFGDKTVEELGCVPYVTKQDLKEEYHIVKKFFRKCEACGRRMHKASAKEMSLLPCPKCGKPNRPSDAAMWD